MKVYTRIVMDLNGTVLEEDSYEYTGPVMECKGGGSTTVVNTIPPPTPAQQSLQDLQLQTAQKQAQQFSLSLGLQNPAAALSYLDAVKGGQTPANSIFTGLEAYDTPDFRTQLNQAQTNAKSTQDLTNLAQEQLTAQLTGKANLTPDQQKLLDTTYQSAQSQGEYNIDQFLHQTANMRGLNVSDSPVAQEGARATGMFNLGMQSSKAEAALNLGQANKIFATNVDQFQQQLQQQAMQNRMSLATYQNPTAFGLGNQYLSQQLAQGTQKTSYNVPGFMQTLGGIGSVAGGLGGLGLGLGAMAQGGMFP